MGGDADGVGEVSPCAANVTQWSRHRNSGLGIIIADAMDAGSPHSPRCQCPLLIAEYQTSMTLYGTIRYLRIESQPISTDSLLCVS